MGLAAILAAVMLKALSPVGVAPNATACLGLAGAMTQETVQDQNPQNPSDDPAAAKAADTKEADTKETDSKIEDTPTAKKEDTATAKKTEEPKPEKPRQ